MHYTDWYGMDTENNQDGVVTLVALASEKGDVWIWHQAGKFREWCDNNQDDQPVVICHNLEYDLVNEFGSYYPYLNLTYLKGRLIMAKYGHVTFYDSFNHFRMPLKKIGDAFGLKKLEFDIHSEAYVTNDAIIPMKAMCFTRDYLESIGGEIGATAGSSAVSVWLHLTEGEYLTGPLDTPWLRAGYAGGRTEIFRCRAEGKLLYDHLNRPIMVEEEQSDGSVRMVHDREASIKGFDVNSMYPYCMLSQFPMITHEDKGIDKTKGMAEITVSVPRDHFVGPLVWRDKHNRLVYPVGVFRGIWTYDEIRYAETIGCKVLKVHKSIGGNFCERPFDDFINLIYAKRKASSNPAEREVLKVILNSLYGKLASKNCITRVVSKYEMLKKNNPRIKDVQWIDHNRGLLDFYTPQQRYVNVLWGAMVTANARILLTKYLRIVPPEKLIYCDTDSIYVNDFELPCNTELGGLKLEKSAKVMAVLQPKAYQLDDFYKAKGIPKPKKSEDGRILIDYAKSFIEDGLAEFEAPIRFRESLRRVDVREGKSAPNRWVKRTKARKTAYTAKGLSGNRYFPPVISQQAELTLTVTSKSGKVTTV